MVIGATRLALWSVREKNPVFGPICLWHRAVRYGL